MSEDLGADRQRVFSRTIPLVAVTALSFRGQARAPHASGRGLSWRVVP